MRLFGADVKQTLERFGRENPETLVKVHTRLGDFTIKLFEETPLHRANFLRLVKANYYTDRYFYRIVYETGIQGGGEYFDRLDYLVPAEYKPEFTHKRGAVGMARYEEGNPEKASSPSEFFIITNEEEARKFNGNYVVFGQVTEGMDVIDKIQQARAYDEKPDIPVKFDIEVKE